MVISSLSPSGWVPKVGDPVLGLHRGKVIDGRFEKLEVDKATILTKAGKAFVTELLPVLQQQELL